MHNALPPFVKADSMEMESTILNGDALSVLRKLPNNSVQCCVTSPPYWGLRDYGVEGQLGQERTPDLYVAKLVEIFYEVRRVLKEDGVLWLNLGDTYVGSNQNYGKKQDSLSLQRSNRGSLTFLTKAPVNARVPGLKPKDLVGIPWWVAFALRNDGWYLRSDVVWYKPNPMPESVKDRPAKAHEYIFLLTKSRKYLYNLDAIREPYASSSYLRAKSQSGRPRYYKLLGKGHEGLAKRTKMHPDGRNIKTVWIVTLKHSHAEHYATYPSDIPNICIRAGSQPGDVVMDPFAGSGTTLVEAVKLGRDYVGIEINKHYTKSIIIPRLRKTHNEVLMHKLFAYPGGKWPIRHLVVSNFPEHMTYVDVFGGSAAILITKEPSKGEVFNDKNEEIVNFFRVVKHRPAELVERAKHWIHSRKMWFEMKETPIPKDELERAFRFWVLLADSFGARANSFGTSRSGIHSVTHAREYLDQVAKRLKTVHIEHLDFLKCISIYDGPETFFYLDPPYRGTRGGDGHYQMLSDEEWKGFRDLLKNIKGKFLLSSNDDPFVRRLFKSFFLREIDVRVTLPKSVKHQRRKELLISNYVLPSLKRKPHRVLYERDKRPDRSAPRAASTSVAIYSIKDRVENR